MIHPLKINEKRADSVVEMIKGTSLLKPPHCTELTKCSCCSHPYALPFVKRFFLILSLFFCQLDRSRHSLLVSFLRRQSGSTEGKHMPSLICVEAATI